MRVVVVGAGATGSLFGGRLSAAGHDVTLVGRPQHVAAMRAAGLSIEGVRQTVVHPGVSETVPTDGDFEAILLATKTYDLESAARSTAAAIPLPIPLLAVQNGLRLEAGLGRALVAGGWTAADLEIVRGVHSVPATFVAPGRVRQAGDGEVHLPESVGRRAEAVATWARLVRSMGYPVRREADLRRTIWQKALVNAAINPVTARHQVVNGRVADPPYRDEALRLLEEARSAARADGISFSSTEAEAELWRVVDATAQNRSSMLQDIDRGRPTEIDAISGEILAIGRDHGLDLPATREAVAAIRGLPPRKADPLTP